jgi:hypothetical protein
MAIENDDNQSASVMPMVIFSKLYRGGRLPAHSENRFAVAVNVRCCIADCVFPLPVVLHAHGARNRFFLLVREGVTMC